MSTPLANAEELTPGEAIEIVLSMAWETALFALAIVGFFCAAVVAVEVFLWFRNPARDAGTPSGKLKALVRSKHFWIAFCCALFAAICLNVIPYYRSYGAYKTDGCEVAGWPIRFWIFGGFASIMRFDRTALVIDVLAAIAVAAGVGIGFRNGMRPLLHRARAWMHNIRTWPRADEK